MYEYLPSRTGYGSGSIRCLLYPFKPLSFSLALVCRLLPELIRYTTQHFIPRNGPDSEHCRVKSLAIAVFVSLPESSLAPLTAPHSPPTSGQSGQRFWTVGCNSWNPFEAPTLLCIPKTSVISTVQEKGCFKTGLTGYHNTGSAGRHRGATPLLPAYE